MAGIQDVARIAGVSQSTVSYVLSGRRPISDATRKKVLAAIEALDYHPHAGARALASSRTHLIGLGVPMRAGVDVNVIMQFVAGIATRARHYDLDVLLVTEREVGGIESISRRSMADGFIVMDVESQDARIESLARLKQPSVLIGMPDDPGSASCIDFDFELAGTMAVRQLATEGHTSLALIGAAPEVYARGTSYAIRFAAGVEREANRRGVTAARSACSGDAGETHALVDKLLGDGVTGFIVHNEAALPSVVAALAGRGQEVAEKIKVVAIGPRALLASPLLNTGVIDIPGHTIGGHAVDMLIDLIDGKALPERRLVAPKAD